MTEALSDQVRLSRRRLAQTTLVGATIGAVVSAGCSRGQKQAASTQPKAQAKRGGVLTHAGGIGGSYDTQGLGFDPNVLLQFFAKSYTLFYERLLGYNLRTFEVEPEIAQKWEQPSQTEYLFHIQPGVKWQNKPLVNGRPLTADDVVWSLERARTNDPRYLGRTLLASIDQITAPDQKTVKITTKGPDSSTLKKLSADNFAVLAREVFDKYPKPVTADAAVGTGPFIMKSVEQGVGAEYVRNPDYWKPGLPYLDGFRTRHFGDPLSSWAAFLGGQVDIASVPGPEVKKYLAQRGSSATTDWYPDDTIEFQYPNAQQKPMTDARVTRALRLLVDHDEFKTAFAETQWGQGQYGSIFPAALASWDLTEGEYRTHLEWKQPRDGAVKEALAQLSAAGFSKEHPLQFTLYGISSAALAAGAQLLQAQWRQLGQGVVDAQLQLFDAATIDKLHASRSYTYFYYGHSVGAVDPDPWLTTTYRTGGSLNFLGFSDPTLDSMTDKQRTIFDEKQRKAAVKEIILYMIDHGPSTIPINHFALVGIQPKVQNVAPDGYLNGRQYQSAWLAA